MTQNPREILEKMTDSLYLRREALRLHDENESNKERVYLFLKIIAELLEFMVVVVALTAWNTTAKTENIGERMARLRKETMRRALLSLIATNDTVIGDFIGRILAEKPEGMTSDVVAELLRDRHIFEDNGGAKNQTAWWLFKEFCTTRAVNDRTGPEYLSAQTPTRVRITESEKTSVIETAQEEKATPAAEAPPLVTLEVKPTTPQAQPATGIQVELPRFSTPS